MKYAYIIKCGELVKDAAGQVIEMRCTADLGSRSGGPTSNRKVKGTLHWVSAAHAIDAEVRLYDRLFLVPEPDASGDLMARLLKRAAPRLKVLGHSEIPETHSIRIGTLIGGHA